MAESTGCHPAPLRFAAKSIGYALTCGLEGSDSGKRGVHTAASVAGRLQLTGGDPIKRLESLDVMRGFDIIRSYSRIDEETYVNAIRNYAQWSAKNLPKLFDYAQKMGISGKVHKAMEVIL